MNKESYENRISNLTKELLNHEKLIEIKKQRREEIKNQLPSTKNKKRRDLEKELSFIDTDDKIGKLVKFNYTEDFLMNVEKGENCVLAMGINPGGGTKIVKGPEVTHDVIFFTNKEALSEEEVDALKIFDNCYVFKHGYHGSNYEIFEKIDARAHWSKEGYLSDEEIKKIVKNCAYKSEKIKYEDVDIPLVIQAIRKMQQNEREKHKGPYVLFGDLIWYNDGTQANLESALKEKDSNFYNNIKEIIELNIEYYNPRVITITNAAASHLVEDALSNENENINKKYKDVLTYKNTPIILGSMVSGQRQMDTYSKARFKDRIEEFYMPKNKICN